MRPLNVTRNTPTHSVTIKWTHGSSIRVGNLHSALRLKALDWVLFNRLWQYSIRNLWYVYEYKIYIVATISGWDLLPYVCWMIFHSKTDETSQASRYFIAIFMVTISLALTFAAGTHDATYKRINLPHSLRIPLGRIKLHAKSNFKRTATLWNR